MSGKSQESGCPLNTLKGFKYLEILSNCPGMGRKVLPPPCTEQYL
jgi:hypothetical protein